MCPGEYFFKSKKEKQNNLKIKIKTYLGNQTVEVLVSFKEQNMIMLKNA